MSGHKTPFRRINRPLAGGNYDSQGRASFYCHPEYATDGAQFCRSYTLLVSDLEKIFAYVEPADENRATFSLEILGLLMRFCIEIEANFKAILIGNDYPQSKSLTMKDYRKAEISHKLSHYVVKLTNWRNPTSVFQPFGAWSRPDGVLNWYQSYNDVKHSRHDELAKASFYNLIQAASALTVLIWAQFGDAPFTAPNTITFNDEWGLGGFSRTATDLFFIRPPFFDDADRYDFNHQDLWQGRALMRSFDFGNIK